ncbi:hypothetical protein C8J57DRAFT_1357615 [Mycena rebaudengoi]|nr:hypothetical protein C8J57DRAFT_1357615 [Mycena rebaudengoi]
MYGKGGAGDGTQDGRMDREMGGVVRGITTAAGKEKGIRETASMGGVRRKAERRAQDGKYKRSVWGADGMGTGKGVRKNQGGGNMPGKDADRNEAERGTKIHWKARNGISSGIFRPFFWHWAHSSPPPSSPPFRPQRRVVLHTDESKSTSLFVVISFTSADARPRAQRRAELGEEP